MPLIAEIISAVAGVGAILCAGAWIVLANSGKSELINRLVRSMHYHRWRWYDWLFMGLTCLGFAIVGYAGVKAVFWWLPSYVATGSGEPIGNILAFLGGFVGLAFLFGFVRDGSIRRLEAFEAEVRLKGLEKILQAWPDDRWLESIGAEYEAKAKALESKIPSFIEGAPPSVFGGRHGAYLTMAHMAKEEAERCRSFLKAASASK